MKDTLTFIVSAYDRPLHTHATLGTIAYQDTRHQVIVCLNSTVKTNVRDYAEVIREWKKRLPNLSLQHTGKWGARCCYESAEMVVDRGIALGKWLTFACDDTVYSVGFADLMLRAAREQNLDIVLADAVLDPMRNIGKAGRYGFLKAEPVYNRVVKTNFIVKRDWFKGFPGKRIEGPSGADGLFVEDAVKRGARWGKPEGQLLIHQ